MSTLHKLLCNLAICFLLFPIFDCASRHSADENYYTGPSTSAEQRKANVRFEISFPATLSDEPITGRVFVVLARNRDPDPRLRIGKRGVRVPFFAADVIHLPPGQAAIIDASTLGFPYKSLRDLPAGDYYAQALLNVYTEFHRSDGHTIWAHMDQWEGQQFNQSSGNLCSQVWQVHLDPMAGYDVKLSLALVVFPATEPKDTPQVKHVKIHSKLLSQFWGRPFDLGATVLLPKGYDAHPDARYPVIYVQDHLSLQPPFYYSTEEEEGADNPRWPETILERNGVDQWISGYKFHRQWDSDSFPRMIAVTFRHPTPYFDDSYAVNSANNGPYGDALMTELIPYLEEHFRIIRKPYARVLTGGSTGGWESLALQVLHPDFFGGTWTFFPDPIDFHRYQLIDIYNDDNAFVVPGHEEPAPERPLERTAEGQVVFTVREMSQLEEVLGTHGRSGQQLEAWEAVYGPMGADGYPKPLWDKLTGKIDHSVAKYMRDHGYDLRYYLEQNWTRIGPQLIGKIHIYCGDMDNFYFNLAVYTMQDFLEHTNNPHYAGSFDYGRPLKGHGWSPMDHAQLVRILADDITEHTPVGETSSTWHYRQ